MSEKLYGNQELSGKEFTRGLGFPQSGVDTGAASTYFQVYGETPQLIATLDTTWTKITVLDTVVRSSGDAWVWDEVYSYLIPIKSGSFLYSVELELTFSTSGSPRTMAVRTFNQQAGQPGTITRSRQSSINATANQFVASGIVEITPSLLGSLNELQISAPTGSYSNFRIESASITLIAV